MPSPGEEHKEIAKSAGDWSAKMSLPSMGIESNDSESSKMIMNGWFLESNYTGSMMGQPWKGRSIMGYDQLAKEYVNIWFSQMGSQISVHRGKKCPKGILHLHGKSPNPMSGQLAPSVFMIYPHAEDGSHKMEMHWTGADKKPTSLFMKIEYTRKAAATADK